MLFPCPVSKSYRFLPAGAVHLPGQDWSAHHAKNTIHALIYHPINHNIGRNPACNKILLAEWSDKRFMVWKAALT